MHAMGRFSALLASVLILAGCRTGGLPAVISAAENGAKTLGIERTAAVMNPREDIGAIDAKEIGLSIAAQLVKVHNAQFPREKDHESLHAD